MESEDEGSVRDLVDAAMLKWRQGDVAVLDSFTHVADLRRPVSEASRQAAKQAGSEISRVRLQSAVDGLVVLTQTCDLVRSSHERPFVEVCPLVHVDPGIAEDAFAGERPRFAGLPHLAPTAVADLDRAMTIEKGALSLLERRPGWVTDLQISRFQLVLSRNRHRFAFPDDFNATVGKLSKKIASRHGKGTSPEGELFLDVEQIRVHVEPNWSAAQIDARLAFIVRDESLPALPENPDRGHRQETALSWLGAKRRSAVELAERLRGASDPAERQLLWQRLVDAWVGALTPTGVVQSVVGEAVSERDYSVKSYWESVQLDLDYLSRTA